MYYRELHKGKGKESHFDFANTAAPSRQGSAIPWFTQGRECNYIVGVVVVSNNTGNSY